MAFEASGMTWDAYLGKAQQMGAVVEAFIEGDEKRSPSVQFTIDPSGYVDTGLHPRPGAGRPGQVYLGCRFPADEAYRLAIQERGSESRRATWPARRAGALRRRFRLGAPRRRLAHYGIEINLRKGGTTHPFLMLQFLTGGAYDPATGLFRTPAGQPRFYYASDNLEAPHYKGMTPSDSSTSRC